MLDPSALDLSVRHLAPSATLAINELSADLQRQGRDIVRFGLGQSPFPVPGPVVEALRRQAHQKDYLPVQGLLPLRQAVARFHARRDGLTGRDAAHVMVGPGSKELLFLLQLVYDAELLLPNPSWVSYAPQAGLAGRAVRWLETHGEQDWLLMPDVLEAACDGGSRARVLLLNSPSNPTGRSHDAAALKALADVCRRHQILVLSDEIYGELHHTGAHVSMARFYPEGTIVSAGLSKWCGAGGWRLGTFSFPPELDFVLRAMCAVASESFTSVSAPIQHAAIVAFELSQEVLIYLERSRRVLRALGGWCRERLVGGGALCTVPDGGFYLMPDLGPLAPALRARGIDGSEVLAQRLLEDTGVALLPGTAFGRPSSELSVRMAYVDFDGRAALDSVTESVDDDWIHAHCPRVVEGIDRWVSWMNESEPP